CLLARTVQELLTVLRLLSQEPLQDLVQERPAVAGVQTYRLLGLLVDPGPQDLVDEDPLRAGGVVLEEGRADTPSGIEDAIQEDLRVRPDHAVELGELGQEA